MKKLFLKIGAVLAIGLVIAYQQASALTVVFTVAAGTAWNATNLFANSARVNSVKIDTGTSTGVTNLTYALIDFPGFNAANGWGSIYQTNTGYPNVVQYLTNLTYTVTNFAGLGQTTFPAGSTITNIYTKSNVLWTATNAVAQTSNLWRRISVGNVSSNSVSTITGPFFLGFGLGFTNNNIGKDILVTVDYDNSL